MWEAFLAVRSVARWALQTSQNVLGPPLAPTSPTTATAFEGAEPPPEVVPGQLDLTGDEVVPAFEGAEPPPPPPEPEPVAPAAEELVEAGLGDEPEPDTRSEGEKEFEEFLGESSVDEGDGVYWERIANFLHAATEPQSTSDVIKGTKSSQGRIRDLIPRLETSGLIVNKGTTGRPKWALKGAED